jgi:predicted metal-binding protein
MVQVNMDAELARICSKAIELGATDARPLKASSVVTKDWVRLKCEFGCGGYGQGLTCPPHSPTPDTTRKVLSGYEWAVVLKFEHSGANGWKKTHDVIASLERAVFLDGFHAAYGYSCGSCPYCKTCNLKHCVHPEKARPSMEASGIDVYSTVRAAGFDIHVVKNRDEEPTYFSMLLVQ